MNNFNATTKNAINIVSDMLYINIGDEKNIGDHQKVLLIISLSSLYAGAYAAFSAGEGCTLSLSGPHVSSP